MYFLLYDRGLNSFDGSYILESWTRTQRAYDFDDMQFIGEAVSPEIEPFFVVAMDYRGKQLFGGLCSNPEIDEKTKKSTIIVKDFLTLFNTDIIIDMAPMQTVKELFEYIAVNCNCGFSSIQIDTTEIASIILENKADKGNYLAYEIMSQQFSYYGIYAKSWLDINAKKIVIKFAKLGGENTKKIRLKDFGVERISKNIGEITRVAIFGNDFKKIESFVLGYDNNIYKEPTSNNLVYPLKTKNFVASSAEAKDVEQAKYDALMELAKNRYNENIDIEDRFNYLENVDFGYLLEVSTEKGIYKMLPLGEIETDSKGKHLFRVGYRPQLLTQIL